MTKLYVVQDVPPEYTFVMGTSEYASISQKERIAIHGEYETLAKAVAECDRVNAQADQHFYTRDADGEWEQI